LATIETCSQTAAKIKSDTTSILTDFNLNDKFKYITTDNCPAMISAFSDEEWISCSAHNINLLHKHSYRQLKSEFQDNEIVLIIKASKELVQYCKRSGIQQHLDIKLKQSINTRWDSKYLMLESIQKCLPQLKIISLTNSRIYGLLVKINENILSQLLTFLRAFHELRMDLCKDNEPTLYLVLPTKQKMLLLCNQNESDSEIMIEFKSIYKENIEKYIVINDWHIIATVLYPPLRHINNLVTIDKRHEIIAKINQIIADIKTTVIVKARDTNINKVNLCLKDFIDFSPTNNDNIDSEIESYLNFTLNYDFTSPILSFWEQNKQKYPRLHMLANRVLSIPATNLSSERNFSACGQTLVDNRSN
jgi:hypothetical protein